MKISYICPFCHKKTSSEYETFLKQGVDGAEYSCVCHHCLNVATVVVTPTQMFFVKFLNKMIEIFKN